MYRNKVRSGGKGAFDHYLCKGRRDRGKNMAAAEHSGPDRHEVCNGVISIANEL
jgi:hypothetical protein